MSLTLFYHPLSSFCHKALIALYENDTPCKLHLVDLGKEPARGEFLKVWPIGKFPVLRDDSNGQIIPESSIIIEYLDRKYPGRTRFIPTESDAALRVRALDRLFDSNLHVHMQKVVLDRLRPAGQADALGVEQAKQQMTTALTVIEGELSGRIWAAGETFSLADCAAAPALFYSDKIIPLKDRYPRSEAYLQRLKSRASYARVLKEAEPYFSLLPK
jgi:glutathione S-transferase